MRSRSGPLILFWYLLTTLLEQARKRPNIQLLEQRVAVDLITERRLGLPAHDQIGGHDGGASGTQRGIPAIRAQRGIRIEIGKPIGGRGLLDLFNVIRRMHQLQLLDAGTRCVHALNQRCNARRNQLIIDGRQALGTLRVMRAHLVFETIGMADEDDAHGHTLLFVTIHCKQSMIAVQFSKPNDLQQTLQRAAIC